MVSGIGNIGGESYMEKTEVIFKYEEQEAIEDGFLMNNHRADAFEEVSIITSNLYESFKKEAFERNKTRVFSIDENYLLGCSLLCAKDIYENKKFKGDNDENFFVLPKSWGGLTIWCVRNENGKLTMMLPEDY